MIESRSKPMFELPVKRLVPKRVSRMLISEVKEMAARDQAKWRREWKPDLDSRPWRPFSIGEETFLVKSHFTEDEISYEVCICDLKTVWTERIDKEEFQRRCKELNKNVEAKPSYLLRHVQKLADVQRDDSKYSVQEADNEMVILVRSSLPADVPFVWEFRCHKTETPMIGDHLVEPLLATVGELCRRQNEMEKIIRKKDEQIQDYKDQGAVLSRRNLNTEPFYKEAFTSKMVLSQEFENVVEHAAKVAFSDSVQDLYTQVMIKKAWISVREQPGILRVIPRLALTRAHNVWISLGDYKPSQTLFSTWPVSRWTAQGESSVSQEFTTLPPLALIPSNSSTVTYDLTDSALVSSWMIIDPFGFLSKFTYHLIYYCGWSVLTGAGLVGASSAGQLVVLSTVGSHYLAQYLHQSDAISTMLELLKEHILSPAVSKVLEHLPALAQVFCYLAYNQMSLINSLLNYFLVVQTPKLTIMFAQIFSNLLQQQFEVMWSLSKNISVKTFSTFHPTMNLFVNLMVAETSLAARFSVYIPSTLTAPLNALHSVLTNADHFFMAGYGFAAFYKIVQHLPYQLQISSPDRDDLSEDCSSACVERGTDKPRCKRMLKGCSFDDQDYSDQMGTVHPTLGDENDGPAHATVQHKPVEKAAPGLVVSLYGKISSYSVSIMKMTIPSRLLSFSGVA